MPVVPTHGSHFARAFKKTTGVAPHKCLSDLRVEEAKRVMLTTKLPLADTALICGFGDQSYFTRVFSRNVGCSPGTWRRNNSDG
jgi:AraC family transcriptional regulator